MSRGRFIVLEGIDGCGSTTQARRLVSALGARGERAQLTFEPTDGPIGSLLRRALRRRLEHEGKPRVLGWGALALLFAADRLDHVESVLEPALAAGITVVSDRYDLSSLAYQSVAATTTPEAEQGPLRSLPEGGAVQWIGELNRLALRPDLTIVINVPAEVAEERRRQRGGEPELYEVSELQRRLAVEYARAETLVPGDRLVHVDGSLDPESVGADVLAQLDALGAAG